MGDLRWLNRQLLNMQPRNGELIFGVLRFFSRIPLINYYFISKFGSIIVVKFVAEMCISLADDPENVNFQNEWLPTLRLCSGSDFQICNRK